MHEFGRALKRWRRLRGVKQSHAAELFGVTQATLSRWERGLVKPRPRALAAATMPATSPAGYVSPASLPC